MSGPFRIRARDILYHDLRAGRNGFEKINVNDSFQIQHAADLYETLYPLLYAGLPPDPDDPMAEAVAQFRREVRQGVLDRLGVAFLVSDHVEPEPRLAARRLGDLGRAPTSRSTATRPRCRGPTSSPAPASWPTTPRRSSRGSGPTTRARPS